MSVRTLPSLLERCARNQRGESLLHPELHLGKTKFMIGSLFTVEDTPRVFYIRADTLSLLAPQSLSDKNGIEFSADLAQEASSAPSEREPRRVSDHSKNQERKKFVHRDNHRDDRDDSRPRENSSRPLFEMYETSETCEVESS